MFNLRHSFRLNLISAFFAVQFLNHGHITIVYGSCQGASRKAIDIDLSNAKPLTEGIFHKHKTKVEFSKMKRIFWFIGLMYH